MEMQLNEQAIDQLVNDFDFKKVQETLDNKKWFVNTSGNPTPCLYTIIGKAVKLLNETLAKKQSIQDQTGFYTTYLENSETQTISLTLYYDTLSTTITLPAVL